MCSGFELWYDIHMQEKELIQKAKDIIEKRYKKGFHTVGSALKTKQGKFYTGICLNSQKVDICSEWSVLGQAFSEGDTDIEMIVALKRDEDGSFEIFPPCGLCRELYITYCPQVKVIISENEIVEAKELLPNAWKKKKN